MRQEKWNLTYQVISILLIVVVYQFLAGSNSASLLPPGEKVLSRLTSSILDGSIIDDVTITLGRVTISLVITITISFFLAVFIGANKAIKETLRLPLLLIFTIPGLIWAMISLIIFGINSTAAIFASSVHLTPFITLIIINGINTIDLRLKSVATVYKVPRTDYLTKFIFPHLFPHIMTAIRTGFTITWKVIVTAEVFGLGNGLGNRLNYAYHMYKIDIIFALIIIFVVVTLVIDRLVFVPIEKYFTKWNDQQDNVLLSTA